MTDYSKDCKRIGTKIWGAMSVGAHDPEEYAEITVGELRKLAKRRLGNTDRDTVLAFLETVCPTQ